MYTVSIPTQIQDADTAHCIAHTVPIRSFRTFLSPSYLSKQEIDDMGAGKRGSWRGSPLLIGPSLA